jgi:uracil-DNA glycosylase
LSMYLTTAVKCRKTEYSIKATTIEECSLILEQELKLFPNLKVPMLIGDVAIKTINYIAKGAGERRVIPAGSTYKIQGGEYFFQGEKPFRLICRQVPVSSLKRASAK